MPDRGVKVELFDQFARVAKAVASGRRVEIVDVLTNGDRTVEELARQVGLSTANASQLTRLWSFTTGGPVAASATVVGNIVFVGDGTVDPEEVWARSTSIPGIQLKLGKVRGTLGKHGLLHTHAFSFIQAPVVMGNTVRDEGFKDAGVEAAWLTPLPWYSEVTGGVYQAIAADDEHPLDFGSSRHDNLPFLGHFKNQFDLNDATTLELGQSILQGRGIDAARHDAYGADVTFRNVPARNSNRRGWILQ